MTAFVVNSSGAVHSVNEDQVEALLQQGFRLAAIGEIAGWYAMQGLEVPDGGTSNDDRVNRQSEDVDSGLRRRRSGV